MGRIIPYIMEIKYVGDHQPVFNMHHLSVLGCPIFDPYPNVFICDKIQTTNQLCYRLSKYSQRPFASGRTSPPRGHARLALHGEGLAAARLAVPRPGRWDRRSFRGKTEGKWQKNWKKKEKWVNVGKN